MAKSPSRILYSVRYLLFYNRSTSLPIGGMPCPASATIESTGGLEVLKCAGAPVASEPQSLEMKISGSIKFMDDFILEALTGANVVKNAAEALGSVQTPVNYFGTSMVNGTTGIASAAIDALTATDTKTQKYILKAVSPTTFDVYISTVLDDQVVQDDAHKLNAAPITLPGAGGTVVIPGTGIVLTGGSGAIALTIDDTCVMTSRHYNNPGSSIVTVTGNNVITSFGAIIGTLNSSRGDRTYFDVPNITPSGAFSISLEEDAFSVNDFEAGINVDPIKGYAMQMVAVRGAGS